MENNYLRQINTVANFGVDILVDANVAGGIPIGDNELQFVVPAGKVIYGAILRNTRNDLTASGAGTVQIKVGGTALGSAPTNVSDIKGKAVAVALDAQVPVNTASVVKLAVATGALTAGSLDVVLLYV